MFPGAGMLPRGGKDLGKSADDHVTLVSVDWASQVRWMGPEGYMCEHCLLWAHHVAHVAGWDQLTPALGVTPEECLVNTGA